MAGLTSEGWCSGYTHCWGHTAELALDRVDTMGVLDTVVKDCRRKAVAVAWGSRNESVLLDTRQNAVSFNLDRRNPKIQWIALACKTIVHRAAVRL